MKIEEWETPQIIGIVIDGGNEIGVNSKWKSDWQRKLNERESEEIRKMTESV